ncbi:MULTISPECIES: hypothetical protein [Rhizobium]|uniref:Uncharacterized protein n=1 Tax=Rhizobium etli TaxID=29449 RepID=A0A7W6VF60_RHIET|nr:MULTISPECIES: hypothetical protein [Rhizobium]MBB4483093.1 hypothetical protein [Rhizobium etli]MBB4538920.1 hypothetical protein [Rhizobium etli]
MLVIVSLSLAAAAPAEPLSAGLQLTGSILHLPVRQLMPLPERFKLNDAILTLT